MSVPQSLKTDKNVAPFMARAQELATVNPVISYYCRLYVLEHILLHKLHTTDTEVGEFTVRLLDETEALKKSEDEGTRQVLNDKLLLASAVVGFAYKVYNSCLALVANYDPSKKAATVSRMRAALNFMSLVGLFTDDGIDFGQLTAGRTSSEAEFYQLHSEKVKALKFQLARVLKDEVVAPTSDEQMAAEEKELEQELEALAVEGQVDEPEEQAEEKREEKPEHEEPGEEDRGGSRQGIARMPSSTEIPDSAASLAHDDATKTSPEPLSSLPKLPGAPHISPEDSSNLGLPGAPKYLPTDDLSLVNKDSPILMFSPDDEPETKLTHPARPVKATKAEPKPVAHQRHQPVSQAAINEILDISDHISKIQKHAKFAISALNYEDLATAEKELEAGLRMLREARAHERG